MARLSRDERRAQLLQIGRDMADRLSMDEISTDAIADVAGISRGLLFHYFGSRHDFVAALVESFTDELLAQTAPSAGEPLEQLADGIERYLAYMSRHQRPYQSLMRGSAGGRADVRAIVERTRSAQADRLLDGAGIDLAAVDPRQRYLARGFVATVEEVTMLWLDRRDVEASELIEMFLVMAEVLQSRLLEATP